MHKDPIANVLLVDRDPAIGEAIVAALTAQRFNVEWVDDDEKAINCLDSGIFEVLVSALNSRRVDGMRLMEVARERNPDVCVIMIAEDPEIELATEAMLQGAYDYQTRPLNLGKLEAVIRRGLEHQRLVYQHFQLRRRLDERFGLANLVGRSRAMASAYEKVRQAAPTTIPIILVGESGTGKDLMAQAIHNTGTRAAGPFVKLDCSKESGALIERELFGHAAGAFPGATESHAGRVEVADGGTLYLDALAGFPQVASEQLLHTLETGGAQRPGDEQTRAADIRLIASVTGALERADTTQAFLGELQRRHGAIVIELPPLRDRKEDIPLLVEHFIAEIAAARETTVQGTTAHAMDLLIQHDWPDNVRELRNTIEGMVIACRADHPLDVKQAPLHLREGAAHDPLEIRIGPGATMDEVERIVIERTLRDCGYKKELCAKTLGIGLRTLYRKLKAYEDR